MGCAFSARSAEVVKASKKDAEIERKNRDDFEKEQSKIKLLLLGAGESGKSTIFKQMRILYGTGYSDDDRRQITPVVFTNVITSMKALVLASQELAAVGKVIEAGSGSRSALGGSAAADAAADGAGAGASSDTLVHAVAADGQAEGGGSASSGAGAVSSPLAATAVTAATAGTATTAGAASSTWATQITSPATASAVNASTLGGPAFAVTPACRDAAAELLRVSDDAAVDDRVADLIARLWQDAGILTTYNARARFQLNDSAAYFFNKVRALAAPDYVPSVEDVLKTRVRTTGIVEEQYNIDKVDFSIFDVGGQKNERRKWIHCFQDVTAVIFVAAISEYDQVLFEDSTTNRLDDALKLFDYVCNSRFFENTSIILFLNKRDLFAEKIKTIDLRQPNPDPFKAETEPVLFADYTGGCNYESAISYLVQRFLTINRNPKKEIFWRVTCATDTDNVATVFQAAKEIILKHNLITSGFLE